jgi:hypothetical protein
LIQRLGGVDLIIFDNIMALILGSMKEEEPWQQILPWVRSLTGRNIGQIWGHHTGHDEGRSYGTKTREWQLDTVIELEAAHRDDTDVSFKLEFTKARERAPGTRADFQTVRIALVDYQWHHEAPAGQRPGRLSPLAKKFLEALRNVLAGGTSSRMQGRPAATKKEWKAECERMGLLDPDKPNSARALFSKNRRKLVAAERIACDGDFTWLL